MTPSQLIHLARVVDMEAHEHKPSGLVYAKRTPNPRWKSGYLFIWKPHEPKGAAQFRELFLSLDYNKHLDLYFKWKKIVGLDGWYPIEFSQWLLSHPEEACQIIFEVTGGKVK